MACNIDKVVENLNKVIDTSIKGNAASITQLEGGNFNVSWGDPFRVKTREQAVRMAEQKVASAHKAVDAEGFNSAVFGPYVRVNKTYPDRVVIEKSNFSRLRRALEIRNEAEEIGAIQLNEADQEFFQQQEEDAQLLETQNDNRQSLLDEAAVLMKDAKGEMFKMMFKADPEGLLKFIAEQYYGVTMGVKAAGSPASQQIVDDFGQDMVDIAVQFYPLETLLAPQGLPPIEPTC